MKVICFIDSLCSGGAQTQLVGLAKLMNSFSNVEVCVATYHDDMFRKSELDEADVRNILISGADGKLKRIYKILRFLKQERPDIVISYLATPNIVASICHILWPKFRLFVSERNTSQGYSLKDRIRYGLYRQAEYIIPNSYTQERYISRVANGLKSKIKVITNFVDTDRYQLASSDKSDTKLIKILTAARINKQKNIPTYIDAIKILKDKGYNIHVDWYGRYDDDKLYENCIRKIQNLGLDNVFAFHDAVSNIEFFYHKASIFCLPSLFEGFPNVVCEAMSCGLPIACSDVCDNADIVSDGVNGTLFNPLSPESIADGIERCIQLIDSDKDLPANNRSKILELCSKQAFIEKYLNLINHIE